MLKKRLGVEAIERDWNLHYYLSDYYFKIPPTLIIPEGCVEIGNFAFWGCCWLEKVVISKNVKRINIEAFYNCISLRKVIIPRSVDYIGSNVLCNCEKAVIILKKPRSEFNFIATDAFWGCRNVKEEVGA